MASTERLKHKSVGRHVTMPNRQIIRAALDLFTVTLVVVSLGFAGWSCAVAFHLARFGDAYRATGLVVTTLTWMAWVIAFALVMRTRMSVVRKIVWCVGTILVAFMVFPALYVAHGRSRLVPPN